LFLISVIAFAVGIYIEAIYPVPLMVSLILCVFFLCFIPIALGRTLRTAFCMILICFVFAGMVRLGIVTENRLETKSNKAEILKPDTNTNGDTRNLSFLNGRDGRLSDEEMNIYEGLVTEASPNTKIIKLISPKGSHGLRAILRTQDNLTINDRVKVFGYIKEFNLTFKNPSITSWKWLKRLEGISYEFKGTIISVTTGENYIQAWRKLLAKRVEDSGAKYTGIIKALTIGDTTDLPYQDRISVSLLPFSFL
jgi:hypothetical protein